MNGVTRLAVLLALALLPACPSAAVSPAARPGLESRAASATHAAPAPPAPVFVYQDHRMRHAFVHGWGGALHVMITEDPWTCAQERRPRTGWSAEFTIPPGPGGSFYSGATIGLGFGAVDAPGHGFGAVAQFAQVDLAPFALVVGGRIRGRLRVASSAHEPDSPDVAGGDFDGELCDLPRDVQALPTTAGLDPVAGTLGGQPFRLKKALVFVDGESVEALALFDADATCAGPFDGRSIVMVDIGGASARLGLVGSRQPARPELRAIAGAPLSGHVHPGWVQFDALSFARGDQLTGSLVAQNTPRTADEAHVAGTFVAEVCGCRRYDCPRGSAW